MVLVYFAVLNVYFIILNTSIDTLNNVIVFSWNKVIVTNLNRVYNNNTIINEKKDSEIQRKYARRM